MTLCFTELASPSRRCFGLLCASVVLGSAAEGLV